MKVFKNFYLKSLAYLRFTFEMHQILKCFHFIHIILIRVFVAITAQGETEIIIFYQSDFVIVPNEKLYITEGSEGVATCMEIINPCGFRVYIIPKTAPLPTGGEATMDLGSWIVYLFNVLLE